MNTPPRLNPALGMPDVRGPMRDLGNYRKPMAIRRRKGPSIGEQILNGVIVAGLIVMCLAFYWEYA